MFVWGTALNVWYSILILPFISISTLSHTKLLQLSLPISISAPKLTDRYRSKYYLSCVLIRQHFLSQPIIKKNVGGELGKADRITPIKRSPFWLPSVVITANPPIAFHGGGLYQQWTPEGC